MKKPKPYIDRYMKLDEVPSFMEWLIYRGWTLLPSTYPVVLSIEHDGRYKEYSTDGRWVLVKPMDFPLVAAWKFEEDFG